MNHTSNNYIQIQPNTNYQQYVPTISNDMPMVINKI